METCIQYVQRPNHKFDSRRKQQQIQRMRLAVKQAGRDHHACHYGGSDERWDAPNPMQRRWPAGTGAKNNVFVAELCNHDSNSQHSETNSPAFNPLRANKWSETCHLQIITKLRRKCVALAK